MDNKDKNIGTFRKIEYYRILIKITWIVQL